ncbi:MAG: hypothetical protein AAF702_24695 [Chloroflexota bacterium]
MQIIRKLVVGLCLWAGLVLIADVAFVSAHTPDVNMIPVPVGMLPSFDGHCNVLTEYADADSLSFVSERTGTPHNVNVYYKRFDTELFICLSGLPIGDAGPTDFAAIYIDRDHDGGGVPRFDDFQLSITRTGISTGRSGDGNGSYTGPDPGSWSARRQLGDFTWSAEFQISASTLGNLSNLIGMSFAHHSVQAEDDDYAWPAGWSETSPDTWPDFGLFRQRLNVPAGSTPIFDGSCSVAEYQDGNQVTFISRRGISEFEVTVSLKHDATDLYACFSGMPLGNASPGDFATLNLDPANDRGITPRADDLSLRITRAGVTSGGSGLNGSFGGPDPGGWSARRTLGEFTWSAEFQIPRNLAGGWGHISGLGLFHQSVQDMGDDYGWPINAHPRGPKLWADALLETPQVSIGAGSSPNFDGSCQVGEYSDATQTQFVSQFGTTPHNVRVYLKHTAGFLYACIDNMPKGASLPGDFAAFYLDRNNDRAEQASGGDYVFRISRGGVSSAASGDGNGGYGGADPGGWAILHNTTDDFTWDAEFRILRATAGGWDRIVGLSFFHHAVTGVADDYGWPTTAVSIAPNSWAEGRILSGSATNNDLTISAVEVTQAIQDLNNSVPLIARKAAVVRVHVQASQQEAPETTARLYARRNGSSLGPGLFPTNPGGRITVLPNPDRGQLNDSFYFVLPWSWLEAGDLELEARINTDGTVSEQNQANNSHTTTVTFEQSRFLELKLVGVRYSMGGTSFEPSTFDRTMLRSWLARAYPIPGVSVQPGTLTVPGNNLPDVDDVNSLLGQMRSLDLAAGGSSRRIYYGMVDDGGGFMRGKAAGVPSRVASGPTGSRTWGWDNDGSYGDWYGAHEVAHTLGRKHAEYCGAEGGASYPYAGGKISPVNGSFYGFDVQLLQAYTPDWADVMTYCDFQWISDFTYKGIHNYLNSQISVASSTPMVQGEHIAVFGLLDLQKDIVALDAFYRLTDPATVPERLPGDYLIQLFDKSGKVLAEYRFTPHEDHEGAPAPGSTPAPHHSMALINEVVPWLPDTDQIAILHGGTVLAVRQVSANAPTVTLGYPNGREVINDESVTVKWTAKDADGDPLTFAIQYSTDGGTTWTTLAVSVKEQFYTIPATDLPGSTQSLIRVIASDGVHTAQDDSDNTFQVANKIPQPTIFAPGDNHEFVEGQTITFQGNAADLEDGTLSDSALRWTSDLDGELGTGSLLSVGLMPGTHRITLTATDSANETATATITVNVNSHGSSTASGLTVVPTGLTVRLPSGSGAVSREISLRDWGGDEFTWMAESNQPWLSLDSTEGVAPGTLIATIGDKGLALGTYVGTITIQAGLGSNDPQTVDITLVVEDAGEISLSAGLENEIFLPLLQNGE